MLVSVTIAEPTTGLVLFFILSGRAVGYGGAAPVHLCTNIWRSVHECKVNMRAVCVCACVYVRACVHVCVCVSMCQQGVIEGNLHLVEAEHQKALLPHQLTAIELQQKKYSGHRYQA